VAGVQQQLHPITNQTEDAMKNRLPPDPEKMNHKRATWAAAALNAFKSITGTDEADALGDLLCDLMHWSDRNRFYLGSCRDK
jgi:hypothetical protein